MAHPVNSLHHITCNHKVTITPLHNMSHESLRNEPKLTKFKTGVKEWVRANVDIKPKASFSSISETRNNQPPPAPEPPSSRNLITRYFTPIRTPPVAALHTGHSPSVQTEPVADDQTS